MELRRKKNSFNLVSGHGPKPIIYRLVGRNYPKYTAPNKFEFRTIQPE